MKTILFIKKKVKYWGEDELELFQQSMVNCVLMLEQMIQWNRQICRHVSTLSNLPEYFMWINSYK